MDIVGISEKKGDSKWVTHICIDGVDKYLGEFNTDAEIDEAYRIEMSKL